MIKTRVAPSPTGEIHIGNMRSLLYSYALAKKYGGNFILRIEDTDAQRYVSGAVERIYYVIKEYGFTWDEGPFIQSERLQIYKEHAQKLVESGHAYYCFCTKERLESLRTEQKNAGVASTKYDKKCMSLSDEQVQENLSNGMPFVIRLNMPDDTRIEFEDKVYGKISFPTKDIDDQVLIKSDGFPTYHLAVVVDDHLMGVTHILRGMDWIPSTPKHIYLYKAFGWELPIYAHLPLLKELGSNKKLSKRLGAVSALEFLEEGYLPEALVNFLMFLGWNPGDEREVFTLSDFVKEFDLDRIHKTDLVVFDRDKLLWYNGYYIRQLSIDELYLRVVEWSKKYSPDSKFLYVEEVFAKRVLSLIHERLKTLAEVNDLASYFFVDPKLENELYLEFVSDYSRVREIISEFINVLSSVTPDCWNSNALDELLHSCIREKSYKPKEAFMTLRIALTGRKVSPPIFDTMEVLGKDITIKRLKI